MSEEDIRFRIEALGTGKPLKITAIALAEGRWRGTWYNYDEIKKAAPLFIGLDMYHIHNLTNIKEKIGKVTSCKPLDDLKALQVTATIDNEVVINEILSGHVYAVSPLGGWRDYKYEDKGREGIGYIPVELSTTPKPICHKCLIFSESLSKTLSLNNINDNDSIQGVIKMDSEETQFTITEDDVLVLPERVGNKFIDLEVNKFDEALSKRDILVRMKPGKYPMSAKRFVKIGGSYYPYYPYHGYYKYVKGKKGGKSDKMSMNEKDILAKMGECNHFKSYIMSNLDKGMSLVDSAVGFTMPNPVEAQSDTPTPEPTPKPEPKPTDTPKPAEDKPKPVEKPTPVVETVIKPTEVPIILKVSAESVVATVPKPVKEVPTVEKPKPKPTPEPKPTSTEGTPKPTDKPVEGEEGTGAKPVKPVAVVTGTQVESPLTNKQIRKQITDKLLKDEDRRHVVADWLIAGEKKKREG